MRGGGGVYSRILICGRGFENKGEGFHKDMKHVKTNSFKNLVVENAVNGTHKRELVNRVAVITPRS